MDFEAQELGEEQDAATLLKQDIDSFKSDLRDENMGKKGLERLARHEKSGKDRDDYIQLIEKRSKQAKLERQMQDITEDISQLNNTLGKVTKLEDEEHLDREPQEITQKTVKELRNYLKENNLSLEYLKEVLEAEKSGKNRKTAKNTIKRHMKSSRSSTNIQKIINNLDATKKMVEKFNDNLDESAPRLDFSAIETKLKTESNHNEQLMNRRNTEEANSSDLSEMVDMTDEVIELLRESQNIDDAHIEELSNKALLALQAENYDTFRESLEKIQDAVSENDLETDKEDSKTSRDEHKEEDEHDVSLEAELKGLEKSLRKNEA